MARLAAAAPSGWRGDSGTVMVYGARRLTEATVDAPVSECEFPVAIGGADADPTARFRRIVEAVDRVGQQPRMATAHGTVPSRLEHGVANRRIELGHRHPIPRHSLP